MVNSIGSLMTYGRRGIFNAKNRRTIYLKKHIIKSLNINNAFFWKGYLVHLFLSCMLFNCNLSTTLKKTKLHTQQFNIIKYDT